MNKGKDKAKPEVDFEILHSSLVNAVICTRLAIDEAVKKMNRESPSGTRGGWQYKTEETSHSPCPDGQGKTHYRLFC